MLPNEFPTGYGGMSVSGNGPFNCIILISDPAQRSTIQSYVDNYVREQSPDAPAANTPGWPTKLTYEQVEHPYTQLNEIRNQITAQLPSGSTGNGFDMRHNSVIVFTRSGVDAQATQDRLRSTYATEAIVVQTKSASSPGSAMAGGDTRRRAAGE